MDPLSIIASTVAIAGAAAQSIETLRSIYGAAGEFQALVNEVSEFRIVLSEVERVILERRSYVQLQQGTVTQICTLLEGAKANLHSLDTIIKDRLIRSDSASGEAKVAQLSWLRQKSKVRRVQNELKGTRNSLSDLWGAAQLSDISHIQLRLDEFTLIHENQTTRLSEHGEYLEKIYTQLMQAPTDGMASGSRATLVENLSLDPHTSEITPCFRSDNNRDARIERHMSIDRSSSSQNVPKTYSALRIRASRYRQTPCSGWCSCICHRKRYLQTPQSFNFLLGSLFLGYTSLPVRPQPCNERSCRQQSVLMLKVTYYFPPWLLSRMLQFAFSISYMTGPELILRMPRVVPGNSEVLSYAVLGNLDGIKSLFAKGLASPYDVCESNGRTALHYAVNNNHRELSQFLMDTGADPNLEDQSYASTIKLAWERIFAGKVAGVSTGREIDAWRCMFDDEEHLESRNFPPIHKIVLGLAKLDLRQLLELSTSAIDDTDADERTALSWAAAKGDAEAVNILLEFGADPNKCSNRGQSPLQWAGQNPSKRCAEIMQTLLDHDADVNLVDFWNRIVLINAAGDLNDTECLKILVSAGSHLNWRDCHNRTALGIAAKGGKTQNVSYLISCGADPRIPDKWGYAPIHEAIQQNYHPLLDRLLREHGIITGGKTVGGMTILHLAALHSDVETIRLLTANEEIKNLDPDDIDDDNLTPQDLLDSREDTTPELREAFRALVNATLTSDNTLIPENTGKYSVYSNGNNDEEFTDAVEFQTSDDITTL